MFIQVYFFTYLKVQNNSYAQCTFFFQKKAHTYLSLWFQIIKINAITFFFFWFSESEFRWFLLSVDEQRESSEDELDELLFLLLLLLETPKFEPPSPPDDFDTFELNVDEFDLFEEELLVTPDSSSSSPEELDRWEPPLLEPPPELLTDSPLLFLWCSWWSSLSELPLEALLLLLLLLLLPLLESFELQLWLRLWWLKI